jgi:hypothetical protein
LRAIRKACKEVFTVKYVCPRARTANFLNENSRRDCKTLVMGETQKTGLGRDSLNRYHMERVRPPYPFG